VLDAAADTGERVPPPVPQSVRLAPDEPATLVEVFEYVARVHPRPDTLNYKRDGRWVSISSNELLERARRIAAGLRTLDVSPAIASRFFPRAVPNGP